MLISGWTVPLQLLWVELRQLEDEGVEIPDEIRKQCAKLRPGQDDWAPELEQIFTRLSALPIPADRQREEPDDLEAIRLLRPEGPRRLPLHLSDRELLERYHGAWRGRSVGCALGKPVEGKSRSWIRELLTRQGEWELRDFFRGGDPDLWAPRSQRENICCMEPDDDIHYTLIGLRVMEEKGMDFQWFDVADAWNRYLPYNQICTAETQALLNYNLLRPRLGSPGGAATAEFTRRHNNPYREWIGAAIRADFWGYAVPGEPELAASLAYRDACWTHSKNGIYAAMFLAAVISAAFAESDPEKLIQIGLSEIPRRCRLAEAVHRSLEWRRECAEWSSFMDRFDETYREVSNVHAINNLQIVIMALLYGDRTIDRSTALAVMAGLDTDCNGATAGSITGILNSESILAERLNDTIEPDFIGESRCRMRTLAERTLAVRNRIAHSRS